jgi:hypothetical protein
MKKNLLFVLTMGVASISFAQHTIKVEPFITIEHGFFPDKIRLGDSEYESASASTVSVSNGDSPNGKVQSSGLYLSTGAMLEYSMTKRLSVRGGVAFANRHIRANNTYVCVECLSIPTETVFRTGYIDIPLAARYYLINTRFTLYTDAGLTTSPLIYNETIVERGGRSRDDSYAIDEVPFNKLMVMAQFGFGAGIKVKKGGVNFGALYRNGLTKFAATDNYRFKSWGVSLSFFRFLN